MIFCIATIFKKAISFVNEENSIALFSLSEHFTNVAFRIAHNSAKDIARTFHKQITTKNIMSNMLCISRLPRSRRTVQKDVQVFSATIQFRSSPLRIEIFEHRNDIVNILYIPARNADAFHIVFKFFRLLRAHRYAQKFGMRRRNLTHNIQRGKIRRLHPLRLTNRQSYAPRHHGNFLGNILYFVITQNRFRLLRFKNRLPNRNAFLITEREKFQRIVKPATSTIFNTRNIIRNPNDRRFQIFKNDIQQTFFRLV